MYPLRDLVSEREKNVNLGVGDANLNVNLGVGDANLGAGDVNLDV
jgi:hypothetical protein